MRFTMLFIILLTLSFSAHAKRFANQFCEFELPSGWDCALEGSEWVCQSTNEARKKEAIVILAAKIRGEQDTLEQYQAYLKNTKTYTLPGGKTQVSEPKYTNIKEINGQRWVDALHLAAEVPGFYTRYLATTKEDLGIAVTFSVAKDFYDSYQPVFENVISTLRVFRQKKDQLAQAQVKEEGIIGENTTFIPEEGLDDISTTKQKKKGASSASNFIFFGVVVAGAVGYILYKKRKKKS